MPPALQKSIATFKNQQTLQQSYLRNELALLDNVVAQATQPTQSAFLRDLQSPVIYEPVPDAQPLEMPRSGDEIQMNLDQPQADELRLSGLQEKTREDFEAVFQDERVQVLLSSLQEQAVTKTKRAEKTKKSGAQKSKVGRQQSVLDVVDDFVEPTEVKYVNPTKLVVNSNNRIEDEIEELIQIEDQAVVQVQQMPEFTLEQPLQLDLGELEPQGMEGVQLGTEFVSLQTIPGDFVANFTNLLADYKEGKVELLQRGDEVFVKGM